MALVIYHNTNSTTMNDLYLKFDPSSNMNLTNLRLQCIMLWADRSGHWHCSSFPVVTWSPASVSVPVLLPGVVLTISLITRDNLIMSCLCGRPLDPGHCNWVRSQVSGHTNPSHLNKQNVKGGSIITSFTERFHSIWIVSQAEGLPLSHWMLQARVLTGDLECITLV